MLLTHSQAYDTGLGPLRGLYYYYPELDRAYQVVSVPLFLFSLHSLQINFIWAILS